MADYEYRKNILHANLARFVIKRHLLLRLKLSYQIPKYIKRRILNSPERKQELVLKKPRKNRVKLRSQARTHEEVNSCKK